MSAIVLFAENQAETSREGATLLNYTCCFGARRGLAASIGHLFMSAA